MVGLQHKVHRVRRMQTQRLVPGLERSQERSLFFEGLEGTVTELGGGIDELELNLLQVPTGSVDHQRLANGNDTLLRSRDRALDNEEVILDNTVVREATNGSDGLLSNVGLRRRVGLVGARANAVDLLIDLGTVVVPVCRPGLALSTLIGKIKPYFDRHERQRT